MAHSNFKISLIFPLFFNCFLYFSLLFLKLIGPAICHPSDFAQATPLKEKEGRFTKPFNTDN